MRSRPSIAIASNTAAPPLPYRASSPVGAGSRGEKKVRCGLHDLVQRGLAGGGTAAGEHPLKQKTDGADAKPGTERETGGTDRRGPDTCTVIGASAGALFRTLA